ncbi:MAG: hypothetical protein CMI54_05605 [Parcubacteria group bacterium]|jgi:hypothetical protein|nr:hypothetical protein [Parcubacteria group bacterium]|tara:strand:- start:3864 stop:4067 length:204 start_codon:yes stop_codon:yes gene_type:complete
MDENKNEQGSLFVETTKLLQTADLVEVSYHTGVPHSWLNRIKLGMIPDPSVNRMQVVYEFIKGEKLC